MLVSIADQGLKATVQFAYNVDLVDIIRSIPGRHWRADERRWTIPSSQINGCAALFHDAGCIVTVDGNIWTPPAQPRSSASSSRVELLTRLFESIPERLAQPTHRALIRVWHPDADGDHQLTQDLNTVWSRTPMRSKR